MNRMGLGLLDWIIRLARPYWARGKGRLFNSLVSSQGEREEFAFGSQFRLDLSDYIQKNIYLGTYEPHETSLVSEYLQPGMTFIDIGANVGYYTALAASKVGPQGKVLAVEPSPYVYRKLEEMVRKNRLEQVRTYAFALGEEAGTANLVLPAKGNHAPTLLLKSGVASFEVPVRTLDDCLAEWNINYVDLIKIDVEGFELRLLRGALRALDRGAIGAILCEFNDYWLKLGGASPEELFTFLESHGLKCQTGQPHFIADGNCNLLFVRTPERS